MRPHSQNVSAALAIGVALTVIGGGPFNILPLLTAGAADTLGYSDRQVGVFSLTLSAGAGASSLLAASWVRSVNWSRAAAYALAGMLAANSLTMLVHAYWPFVIVQGVSGFCSGAVFSLGLTLLSDYPDSARSFGVSTGSQVISQVAALLAGPTLLRLGGMNAVLAVLAISSGLGLFLVPLIPAHRRTLAAEPLFKGLLKPATLLALAAFCIYFVNAGGYWTYIELMGQARAMTARVVANSIAVSLLGGIVGGALAWVLGDRFGKLLPIAVAALLTVVSALLLNGSSTVAAFVVSGLLYVFAWNCSWAYQLAVVNAVDGTGRGVAVTTAFGFIGVAAGAGLAALFVSPGDYHAVIWLEVLGACLSLLLVALSTLIHTHYLAR